MLKKIERELFFKKMYGVIYIYNGNLEFLPKSIYYDMLALIISTEILYNSLKNNSNRDSEMANSTLKYIKEELFKKHGIEIKDVIIPIHH
jgi:hypothetical protein